jgi:4-amino-4-deoxy-L-arabinose transferase-like glycosyltransferase
VKPGGLRKALIFLLAAQALLAAVFVFYRTAEGDEGFYLAAAQRVADGMTLYADFFFPQGPMMPLVFAAFSGWGMTSLLLLRLLALVAGLLLTYQTYRIVAANTGDDRAALTAAFLMAFNGMFLAWHSVFKPFAFVDLFLLLSFGYLLRAETTEKGFHGNAFLSMLFLSTAVNFRSIFLLLLPVYLYFILKSAKRPGSAKTLLIMLTGLIVPSIPALVLFLKAPGNFWFDNVIFHIYREPITPFSALVLHKITVFGKFLALPQTILLLGALLGGWYLLKHKVVENSIMYRRALLLAVLICVIYLIPTPVHLQYFQEAVPYLIIAALPVFVLINRTEGLKALRRSAALLYAVGAIPFVWLFIVSPLAKNARFELPQLRSVVAEVQARTSVNDTLLSEWAGYAALSQRPQLSGSEHVGFYFPLSIDREAYARNHLLTNDDIARALQQKRPKLVVIDYKVYSEWQSALDGNYRLASTIGETMLYERNHDTL